ncbi:MAG TPA: PilN domain-containing protein [Terriglobales bacterium]|nr:PilN domain-containing protein [Terriglobales bacterium]
MKIAVNLASRPYEDEGQFYRHWGTALALAALFTAFMVFISVRHYHDSQREWESARQAQSKLAELKKESALAQQVLARPENRGTRDESQFLNGAILRKSFSWTKLMEDMEKVMPAGLRVTSIAPVVDQRTRFTLKVQVEGETRDTAIELLRNMERSPHFRSPQLSSETHGKPGEGTAAVRSDIITSYLPHQAIEGGE